MSDYSRFSIIRTGLLLVYVVSLLLFPFLVLGPWGGQVVSFLPRVMAFAGAVLIGDVIMKFIWPNRHWAETLLATLLIFGVVYKIASYLPDISTDPLTLGWSEASRYYYASLFFSKGIYGVSVPPSVLHPTRYLMQGLPFLIPELPIWFHRLWQVLLWIVFTFWASILLMQRLNVPSQSYRLLYVFWAFLFLLQGPVYYHLLVMVILVLLGYDSQRPWKTMAFVILASLWAGVSRINWVPVPGMLAATLYFFQVPVEKKPLWRYLALPVLMVAAGSLFGLLSQQAYMHWSGNPLTEFNSSFTSDLLWYRLFPSRTYPLGVLPAVFLVSAPLGLIALYRILPAWRQYHPIRLLGIASILFVLFAGGIVVSAKIGGGSNLHNMDAYLSLLLIAGSYIYFGRFVKEEASAEEPLPPAWVLVAAGLIIPVLFSVTYGSQLQSPNWAAEKADLPKLKQAVDQAIQNNGQVLFISERQLLTFHDLEAPLVADYEKVFLMEMAMANNRPYLNQFYDDLRNHRFALIVSHPLKVNYQGGSHQFGEENDAFVSRVTEPILCYYQPAKKMTEVGLELLVPRAQPGDCTFGSQ